MAFLEAPIPTERSHVQLEVDDEPTVPEEPTASLPFAARSKAQKLGAGGGRSVLDQLKEDGGLFENDVDQLGVFIIWV